MKKIFYGIILFLIVLTPSSQLKPKIIYFFDNSQLNEKEFNKQVRLGRSIYDIKYLIQENGFKCDYNEFSEIINYVSCHKVKGFIEITTWNIRINYENQRVTEVIAWQDVSAYSPVNRLGARKRMRVVKKVYKLSTSDQLSHCALGCK